MLNTFHIAHGHVYLIHWCGTTRQWVGYEANGNIFDNHTRREVVIYSADRLAARKSVSIGELAADSWKGYSNV